MKQYEDIIWVKDLMTRDIIGVSSNTNVMEAARVMAKENITSVLIKSEDVFVGILTDHDIINDIVASGLDPKEIRVSEIMSSPLITISESAGIDEAAIMMRDNSVRRLLVKNNQELVGLISETDLIRVEPEIHFLIHETSRLEFHPSNSINSRMVSFAGFCEECGNYSEDLEKTNGGWHCEECRK